MDKKTANDIVECKRWQLEEWEILSEFYVDLQDGFDSHSRGDRLAFVERLLEEVRTKMEQIGEAVE